MTNLQKKKVYKKRKNALNKKPLLNEDLVILILSKVAECNCLEHYRCLNCHQRKENLEMLNNYLEIPKWLHKMTVYCIEKDIPIKIEKNGLVIGKHADYYIGYHVVQPRNTFRITPNRSRFDSLIETKSSKSIKRKIDDMKQGGVL